MTPFNTFWFSWDQFTPATCFPNDCFCEHLRNSIVRQPSNTYSCIAFIIYGIWIMLTSLSDRHSKLMHSIPLVSRRPYAETYAFAVISIGVFSAFFHASMTFIGQWSDNSAMALIVIFLIFYSQNHNKFIERYFLLLYLVACLATFMVLWNFPIYRRQMFAFLLITALGLIIRRKSKPKMNSTSRWFLIASLSSLALGAFFWTLDLKHIVCLPDSLFQGHALWHILTATSAFSGYLYLRSESNLTT